MHILASYECQLKRKKLQDYVSLSLITSRYTVKEKEHYARYTNLIWPREKKYFERTDVCFVAALMGSDRFRLCNDVKKSDMRLRVKTA